MELSSRYNAKFLETSAYTGENVNLAFHLICDEILYLKCPKLFEDSEKSKKSK